LEKTFTVFLTSVSGDGSGSLALDLGSAFRKHIMTMCPQNSGWNILEGIQLYMGNLFLGNIFPTKLSGKHIFLRVYIPGGKIFLSNTVQKDIFFRVGVHIPG